MKASADSLKKIYRKNLIKIKIEEGIKMVKKSIALLLALFLCLSILSACGSNQPAQTTQTTSTVSAASTTSAAPSENGKLFDKPITITMMVASHPSWPYNKDWPIVKAVQDATGVTLEINAILDDNDAFSDKVNLAIASGDLPDIICPVNSLDPLKRYRDQGVFASILDYPDATPNFTKWYNDNKNNCIPYVSSEGKLFEFPAKGVEEENRRVWMYRKDIFDKNNLKVPATDAELYDVCMQLKKLYPESTPFAIRDRLDKFLMLAPLWGTAWHSADYGEFRYDFDSNDFIYGPIEDTFKEFITFMAKMYKDGLMPQNFLTIDTKSWEDTINTNNGFITLDYIGRIDGFNNANKNADPNFQMSYMPTIKAGTKGKGIMPYSTTGFYGFLPAAKPKTNKVEDVIKFCDWFYTDQAKELTSWGIEDVTYKLENGQKKFIDCSVVNDLKVKYGISTYGLFNQFDFQAPISLMSKDLQDAYAQSVGKDMPLNPVPPFTEDEQTIISTTGGDVTKFTDEAVSQFLVGGRGLDTWDQYVKETNDRGLAKFKDVYVKAYARLQK